MSPVFAFESKGLNISSKKLKAENHQLKETCESQRVNVHVCYQYMLLNNTCVSLHMLLSFMHLLVKH